MAGAGETATLPRKAPPVGVKVHSGEDQSSVRARYSQDGRRVFVCAGSKVKVHSCNTYSLVRTLSRHTHDVTACTPSPTNAMQLLTASLDGRVLIWDFMDGALLREVDFGVPIFHLAFRPGTEEPQVFLEVEKGALEVDSEEELGAQEIEVKAEKVVVGLSSDVITNRHPDVAPGNQLAQASACLRLGMSAKEFLFTSDGKYVVSYREKCLLVCSINRGIVQTFKARSPISALACHPTDLCIATGHVWGRIFLWWNWSRLSGKEKPVTTLLHWHAHRVSDVCFTSDGTYLLSGGEEGVLVLWKVTSHMKYYRPRLGSEITRISCDPKDQSFAISLQNNTIQIVSGFNNEVEHSLGGLRRAPAHGPWQNGVRTGMQWDPRSRSLVLNANPGFLQWYKTGRSVVVRQLDITGLNYVSRTEHLFVQTTVEHVAFSDDGRWMATVEWRDDRKTTPELKLKFWEFVSRQQTFVLNTCVDPPHDKEVTSLSFQPSPRRELGAPTSSSSSSVAITTSKDSKFKTWTVVGERREREWEGEGEGKGEREKEEEEGEGVEERKVEEEEKEEKEKKGERTGEGKRKKEEEEGERGEEEITLRGEGVSWACRSVGDYHLLPCRGACFSEDGSLMAVNFEKFLTLWDPESCSIQRSFSCPFPSEIFVHHTFGCSSSSRYLLVSSSHHIIVWDLLSCSVLWSVTADVDVLVSDRFGPLAAAFVPSKDGPTHLYLFNPASPTPQRVWGSVCPEHITSACFLPLSRPSHLSPSPTDGGRLFFLTKSQLLYVVGEEEEDASQERAAADSLSAEGEEGATATRRAYFELFGNKRSDELNSHSIPAKPQTLHRNPKQKVLDGAPHTLAPMTFLCRPFLLSLLPLSATGETQGPPENQANGERESMEEEEEENKTDDDEEEGEKMDSTALDGCMPPKRGGRGGGGGGGEGDTDFYVGCYDWLWTPTVAP